MKPSQDQRCVPRPGPGRPCKVCPVLHPTGGVRSSDPPAAQAQGFYAAALQHTNPIEVAIAGRLEALQGKVDRLRSRVRLFAAIVGTAITNVVIALLR